MNVDVPGFDMDRLGQAIAANVAPMVDRRISQVYQGLQNAAAAQRVGAGL